MSTYTVQVFRDSGQRIIEVLAEQARAEELSFGRVQQLVRDRAS